MCGCHCAICTVCTLDHALNSHATPTTLRALHTVSGNVNISRETILFLVCCFPRFFFVGRRINSASILIRYLLCAKHLILRNDCGSYPIERRRARQLWPHFWVMIFAFMWFNVRDENDRLFSRHFHAWDLILVISLNSMKYLAPSHDPSNVRIHSRTARIFLKRKHFFSSTNKVMFYCKT